MSAEGPDVSHNSSDWRGEGGAQGVGGRDRAGRQADFAFLRKIL